MPRHKAKSKFRTWDELQKMGMTSALWRRRGKTIGDVEDAIQVLEDGDLEEDDNDEGEEEDDPDADLDF